MFRFPASVFNERVAVFVDSFYEGVEELFRGQGWPWEPPRRSPGKWEHPDFAVRVARRFKDGAFRTLELRARKLPGVAAVDAAGHVTLRHEHRFRIDLPRAYPNDLGSIAARCMTALYHPRIGPSGRGKACVYVNGEVDRVLHSIVRQVLLDPDMVQPPSLFRGQDKGMNLAAMNWYETRPRAIHRRLLDLWAEAHGAERFRLPESRGAGVEIQG
ncbi:MAG: hypothetical protein ACLF0G_13865 [Candidatus Brocadiia bacterium]